MRILLDLQACQGPNMHDRTGRHALALALAMARHGAHHDIRVIVNGAYPDRAAALREMFSGLLPAAAITSFATPLPVAASDPANAWRLHVAERMREHYLASLRPDLVHVAGLWAGLHDNTVSSLLHGEGRFDTAITVRDLRSLLSGEGQSADPHVTAWYQRKLRSLRNAQLLLTMSQHERMEALDVLAMASDHVVNIAPAADAIFVAYVLAPDARAVLLARYGLHRPFILGAAGDDAGASALVAAYAALPGETRRQYQLAVTGSIPAAAPGLDLDDVVLLARVADADLVSLYSCTALFVCPAPRDSVSVLEAMACGAPVIGVQAGSIPEMIGRADAMFAPASVPAMTAAMMRVLADPGDAASLRAHGLARAALFSWDTSAQHALAAFEETHARRTAAAAASVVAAANLAPRPRLAYVSPLPPARSGIADYSAILLPELARFYDIDLVLAQPDMAAPEALKQFPQRSVAWFDAHAQTFDRIVYQFGNSAFHTHMFGLLARHPGVVVLHDFYLSGVIDHADAASTLPNYYSRMLYLSHGYRALLDEQALGRLASTRAYPCNKTVLDRATGVIVHSAHAMALARHWYGPAMPSDWCVLPLLRKVPAGIDRAGARGVLALGDDDFLLCSFGNVAATKCADTIVQAWIDSPASRDPRCHLVFVGQTSDDDFGAALLARIAPFPRIRITGYASASLYERYLAAADAAVQLRTGSRGETSAAVLDCLAWRLPTIVNAHGSAAEVPAQACLRLDDAVTAAALGTAIDALHTDAVLRRRLATAAGDAILAHDPARVGRQMHNAIEEFTRTAPGAREQALLRDIAGLGNGASAGDLRQTVAALAANQPVAGARQLLIDVTSLVGRSAADPALQALHSIIAGLVAAAPLAWRIEPVRHDGAQYRYARRFTLDLLDCAAVLIEDAVADACAGDILLQNGAALPFPPAWLACGVARQHSAFDGDAATHAILALMARGP